MEMLIKFYILITLLCSEMRKCNN